MRWVVTGRGRLRTVSGRSTTGGDARRSAPRVVRAVAITVLSSVLCWLGGGRVV